MSPHPQLATWIAGSNRGPATAFICSYSQAGWPTKLDRCVKRGRPTSRSSSIGDLQARNIADATNGSCTRRQIHRRMPAPRFEIGDRVLVAGQEALVIGVRYGSRPTTCRSIEFVCPSLRQRPFAL
jgi:hypothetical protein